ncbi:hypothetical protein [Haloarcula nitratireducens]|uniref:ABC transporter substrate-binding protein n=1 Tax=Haloarcula nitratireducens TaxID=2487749 RepID=A0AAW4PI00_9EURY|nr:hypothetical protein [Halomicroarcula nitratireducens]MBX0297146.1 hypothetical protein [Halomicroarcula nitratireducens]
MPIDDDSGSTRRRFVAAGLGAATSGLLAGCSGSSADGSETDRSAATDAGRGSATAAETDASTGGRYAVSMSPVGEVGFDAVPSDVFTVFPQIPEDERLFDREKVAGIVTGEGSS